jgi:hypothetical protein
MRNSQNSTSFFENAAEIGEIASVIVTFWEEVLETVPQLEVFVSLMCPLFSWLLSNENWKLLLSVIHRISMKCDHLLISDELRSSIEDFIVIVSPLILSEESIKVLDILLILESIRSGNLISASVEQLNSLLGSDESFRIILGLLNFLKEGRIALHCQEAALLIRQLLNDLAADHSDFDEILVSLALSIVQKDLTDAVVEPILDCIGFLGKHRLESVVRFISKSKCDRHFTKRFERLIESQESSFFEIIAEMFLEVPVNWFARESIFCQSFLWQIEDETFVRLFLAILKIEPPPSKLFLSLFGDISLSEICDEIGHKRPESFPLFF